MSRTSRLLVLCLGLSLGAMAPHLGGCAIEEGEESEVDEAELATRLSATSITTETAYKALATDGGGFGQAGRSMKFLIDARNPAAKKVYFVNANYKVAGKVPDYAKYHYYFAQKQLGITETNEQFNDKTYFVDDKRFYAGTIQTYQLDNGKPLYAVQLYPDDVIHDGGITELVKTIKGAFKISGARMAFVAGGPQQKFASVKADLTALGYESMSIDQVLAGVKYLPLNPGEAWGYLRIFPRDLGDLRPSDIVVFDELPLDLSVVAGTITHVFQDVTSHVNLKSKERGTPNMVLREASPTNPELARFANKPVHLVVGKTGYVLEATTKEIVDAKLAAHTNKPWIPLPKVDEANLGWFDSMCPTLNTSCTENGSRWGGKAAMLGFLSNKSVLGRKTQIGSQSAKVGYDLTPWGFGVPVKWYRDFVAANPTLKVKIDALVAAEKGAGLSPNERRAKSDEVRLAFYAAKVPAEQLTAINASIAKMKQLVPDMTKLKFRSSANAEDIPNFDGAGLHDSFSVKLSSTDNADLSCVREESQDGVVTKLEMSPKTPQCGIKGVYASLWNPRALEERSFARIDHATAAMGLAVVPAYDTDSDVSANGVVITRAVNSDFLAYTLGLQKGNELVTNPTPGTIAETTLATFSALDRPARFTLTRHATPVANQPPMTTGVLTTPQMVQLVDLVKAVEIAYCKVKPGYYANDCRYVFLDDQKASALDLEFKLLENGHFVVKQSREFHGQ